MIDTKDFYKHGVYCYFKEANDMDIPGKLREDLKRIYGAVDPLNCIEDIQVTEGCGGTELKLTLRVPMSCERFAKSSPLYGRHSDALDSMRYALNNLPGGGVWGFDCCGQPKPPAPQPVVAKKTFVRPERVFFNGNSTVLVWPNGEKTVVGLGPDAVYDEYAGFCAAIVKKLFGSSKKAQRFLDSIKVVQKPKAKKKQVEEECCDACRIDIPAKEEEANGQ